VLPLAANSSCFGPMSACQTAVPAGPGVRLAIRRLPENPNIVEVTWDAPGAVLEVAPTVLGPWNPMPTATSPHLETVPPGGARFFQLNLSR
jgi:hypothetical protein